LIDENAFIYDAVILGLRGAEKRIYELAKRLVLRDMKCIGILLVGGGLKREKKTL